MILAKDASVKAFQKSHRLDEMGDTNQAGDAIHKYDGRLKAISSAVDVLHREKVRLIALIKLDAFAKETRLLKTLEENIARFSGLRARLQADCGRSRA